jgi:hypothetical protein
MYNKFRGLALALKIRKECIHPRLVFYLLQDDEFSELWTKLTDKDSRQLARGKLSLEIRTERGVVIKGDIGPRPSCDSK